VDGDVSEDEMPIADDPNSVNLYSHIFSQMLPLFEPFHDPETRDSLTSFSELLLKATSLPNQEGADVGDVIYQEFMKLVRDKVKTPEQMSTLFQNHDVMQFEQVVKKGKVPHS